MQSYSTIMRPVEVLPPSPLDDTDLALVPVPVRQSLAADTPIQTATGIQRLDALEVGHRVLTRSGTFEPIIEIDHTHFTKRQLQDDPDLAPIRFDPGALPGIVEDTATLVSPDCPIAWAENPVGMDRFPARAFCDGGLIRWVMPDEGIHYIRLHFANTQEICAGSIWVELNSEDQEIAQMNGNVPKLVHEIRIFRPLRG